MVQRLRHWFGLDAPRHVPMREGYAAWADSYPARPHNPLMEVEQGIVAPIVEAAAPERALDVGTGTGRYLPVLVSAGATLVVGLDLSMAMLTHQLPQGGRVCADATSLPFADGSFDLVCSSLMVGDVNDLGPWIAEATRVLAPGGQLVYSDFHPSWAARQWKRTFRSVDGQQLELSYFPHQIDDHLTRLETAGMSIRAIREPRLAGRPDPVVAIFHAEKRGPMMARRVRPGTRDPHTSPTRG